MQDLGLGFRVVFLFFLCFWVLVLGIWGFGGLGLGVSGFKSRLGSRVRDSRFGGLE